MSYGSKGLDAKKVLQRLRFDDTLEAHEYTIGWMEPREHAHRKSGAEAWSNRVHDVLQEVPFSEFLQRFKEDIPYHRIAHVKLGSTKTWESEYYRKKLALANEAAAYTPPARRAPPGSAAAFSSSSAAATATPSPGSLQGCPPLHSGLPCSPISSSLPAMRGMCYARSPSPVVGGSSTEFSEDDGDEVGGGSDDDNPQWQLELDTDEQQQQQQQQQQQPRRGQQPRGEQEEQEAAEQKEVFLPEACWMAILCQLSVRDVCMTGQVNRWLRQLCTSDVVWQAQHRRVMGYEPPPDSHTGTLRRLCRRSALRAARWLEADVQVIEDVGFQDTTCLQLDDSKVLSADASVLRLWSHADGKRRRIATLPGHAGRVTCVAYNEEHILSGCTQSAVRLWSMDDLKCRRTLRGHEAAITGVLLTRGGIPVSSSEDGRIRLWDVSTGAPVLDLDCHAPVLGLASQESSGYLVSSGHAGVQIWDLEAATHLHTLDGSSSLQAGLEDEVDGLGGSLGSAFSCVAFNGNLLAAGRAHEVALWDSRTQHQVGVLARKQLARRPPPVGTTTPVAAGSTTATGGEESSSGSELDLFAGGCCGVQLDEWKLAVGFGSTITLHDIRTAGATFGGTAYTQPFLAVHAPARVNCFQFHKQQLVAGLDGQSCCLWSFQPPLQSSRAASHAVAELQQLGGLPTGGPGVEGEAPLGRSPGDGSKAKKKAPKPKKHGRYPKRTTK